MHLVARTRHIIARHPLLYWLAVAGVAAVLAALVAGAVADVDAQRRSWGTTRQVWVALADHQRGDPVHAEQREVPAAMAPAAAATADPAGRIARQAVAAGEVITDADIVGEGVLALVPSGAVALSIANAGGAEFRVGDPVVVFESGRRLAAGDVVAVLDDSVMVAVSGSSAAAVSQAALDGTAVVGLAG